MQRPKWVFLIRRFQPASCISFYPPFPTSSTPLAAAPHSYGSVFATAIASACPSKSKQIDLLVDDTEIRRRLEDFRRPPTPARGYKALYRRTVTQAPEGCDFDFLTGVSPDA